MSKYRVFISYRHADEAKVEILADILRENGLEPMWDPDIRAGSGFGQVIMDFIAHSHIFVPFITTDSIERGWVNQEIGYAKALNIPILPISLDELPPGMISHLQAEKWDDNQEKMKHKLSYKKFKRIILSTQTKPLFECAYLFPERTQMIADFSKRILCMGSGYHGHVRQKARLSSFQIPDRPTNHQIWIERDDEGFPDENRYRLLRNERQWLERHVKECGCSLIIDPDITIERCDDKVAKIRINLLLEFLREVDHPEVKVAIAKELKENITLVGDYFGAFAVNLTKREKGFRQTIFTRHAPTVQRFIKSFDDEIDSLLEDQNVSAEESKNHVIGQLEEKLDMFK